MFTERYISNALMTARMLPIADYSFALVRPRSTFGIAIAANRAMIATTIMISMSVNPRLLEGVIEPLLSKCG